MKVAAHDEIELADIRERANRLKEAVKKGGGVSEVARRAQMPVPSLNNYLAGRDIKASALVKVAQAAGVSVEWLATGNEGPPSIAPALGSDLLDRPAHFWGLLVAIRSCREWYHQTRGIPTLRDVLTWISGPYQAALGLPDRPIEFKPPEETKP